MTFKPSIEGKGQLEWGQDICRPGPGSLTSDRN